MSSEVNFTGRALQEVVKATTSGGCGGCIVALLGIIAFIVGIIYIII